MKILAEHGATGTQYTLIFPDDCIYSAIDTEGEPLARDGAFEFDDVPGGVAFIEADLFDSLAELICEGLISQEWVQIEDIPSAGIRDYFMAIINEREGGTMQEVTYRVKPEYYDLWGAYEGFDVVTESQVEDLSREWDIPVDELLNQIDELD